MEAEKQKKFYFDTQDYELLGMVGRLLSPESDAESDQKLYDAGLHPHGIKSLTASREMRIAASVIRLLDSLEAGRIEDRLHALQALYDEVLTTAQSTLRRNTARVLIQTMKELVRAHGDERRQLMLAHDFRQAAAGTPRIVRRLLHSYHLFEMPEEWSQLAFDHHVHDANTKGRKNPTHLIMDAWLKGIRYLTVIYYNYVEAEAAHELLQAADIMGMQVRIGFEFACPFRGRYVHFIWAPRGFTDAKGFLEFLSEPPVQHLMKKGREASAWREHYVYSLLKNWNERHRVAAGKRFDLDFPALSEKDFRSFVGTGQASLLHLAEYIHKRCLPAVNRSIAELRRETEQASDGERAELEERIRLMREIDSACFLDTWLSREYNTELPDPNLPGDDPNLPDILRLSPMVLLDWLSSMRAGHRITLNLADLGPEDVLELLWSCQGLITHLEIFNLKEWLEGRLTRLKEINNLQLAINTGSAPRLKHMIRDMIKELECESGKKDAPSERCTLFLAILRNIPALQDFYKTAPLRTRIGTDSTSRSRKTLGMGLVFEETLPARVQHRVNKRRDTALRIPISIDLFEQIQYRRSDQAAQGRLPRLLRKLPGCRRFGYAKMRIWHSQSATAKVEERGNLLTLGGSIASTPANAEPLKKNGSPPLRPRYLNTKLSNVLKVLAGLIPAVLSFLYTQDGGFLAWGGAFIFFAITGVRNIMQSVVGGGGIFRSTLLRWNDYVSWTRLCDSLMYTGFSVPLLEYVIRSLLLEHSLGLTVETRPVLVYTVISAVNGFYICAHNLYRGFPKEVAIANIFRSAVAIPVSVLYDVVFYEALFLLKVADPYIFIQPAAAVISKMASDTVAALIEGFADRQTNIRMRNWDYSTQLARVFDTYARLELLFPEKDVPAMLEKPTELLRTLTAEAPGMEITLIINALDLMHFWLYLPRAQDCLTRLARNMSDEERMVLLRSQSVLVCEQEVSRLFVDGLVGRNFGRALAFYLDRHHEYLRAMTRLCRQPLHSAGA